jgi:hypothetical protein
MPEEWVAREDQSRLSSERRGNVEGAQRHYIATAIQVRDCGRTDVDVRGTPNICTSGWLVGSDGAYRCPCWGKHIEAWRELKQAGADYRKDLREDFYGLFPEVSYQPAFEPAGWLHEEIEEFRRRFDAVVGIEQEYPSETEVDLVRAEYQEKAVEVAQDDDAFLW